MNEASVNKAATTLANAVAASAKAGGSTIEANTAQKAQGLATGQFAQGGYTYNRVINPVVAPIQAALITAAKQALFRQSAKNAMNTAQVSYDAAKQRMQDRQQDAQRRAKEESERRYRQSLSLASGVPGTAPGAGSNGVAGINLNPTSNTTTTGKKPTAKSIGGDGYRGRLAYQAQQGDKNAALALKYVGNDGKYYIDLSKAQPSPQVVAALRALGSVGATNAWRGNINPALRNAIGL